MMNPEFRLGDNALTVSWADPKNAGSSAACKVKAVFVKNLPKDATEDQLKKLFEHHGKITKVVLPPAKPGHESNRIGFVHFAERSCAMKALKNTEKYELDGQVVECSLAKPQSDQKTSGGSSSKSSGFLPGYPPQWVWCGWGCLWCSRSRIWCCRPCTREVLSLCMYSPYSTEGEGQYLLACK